MQKIEKLVEYAGSVWDNHKYYDEAEAGISRHWQNTIGPMLQGIKTDVCVDLATGHGRNAAILERLSKKLYLVDIHQSNLDYCKERFKGLDHVEYILNSGYDISGVPDGSCDLVYCFDAMVHFDSDVVRSYLKDIFRALKPGGYFFNHHSNYAGNPQTTDIKTNPHWRNFMTKELYAHYAFKEGYELVEQQLMSWGAKGSSNWGHFKDLDCLTLLRKPLA